MLRKEHFLCLLFDSSTITPILFFDSVRLAGGEVLTLVSSPPVSQSRTIKLFLSS
jgi:hypothetical protein